ncbi:hypothetical protein PCANC_08496 [Puccinia coronata f. sp. avenae]|uniref:Uncharacterized protein n=1 Tax=Puccinia coronata f. sp. avenae TaxID=200324 RepID=A0A2N5T493_9BASI|nr:hypothetical protein PCANC_08496 [Puccinia coronata f. sp. avenae]
MNVDENLNGLTEPVDNGHKAHVDNSKDPKEDSELDVESEGIPEGLFSEPESVNDETELDWINLIDIAMEQMTSEAEEQNSEPLLPTFCQEEAKIDKVSPEKNPWYPFLNKEYLVGSLLIEESVFGNPMFALNAKELIADDLMNPCVFRHVNFVPEETDGFNVYKTSQSTKWLKELQPDL